MVQYKYQKVQKEIRLPMNTRNTSLTIWLLSLFVSLAFTQTAQCEGVVTVEGRESSLLPQGKKFKLVWNDEFDGDRLDASKWSYRTNFWGHRAYWFATPEDNAVEVKDGLLHLKLVKKADGQFVSPQLQTGELVWDVPHEENPKGFWPLPKREKAKFTHRYGYYECRCRLQQMPGWWSAFWMQTPMQGCSLDKTAFHVFGMLWEPDGYTFFIDGK